MDSDLPNIVNTILFIQDISFFVFRTIVAMLQKQETECTCNTTNWRSLVSGYLRHGLNPDFGKRMFDCSPHLYGLRLINYRAI